jgi:glutamate carboxypeptidase
MDVAEAIAWLDGRREDMEALLAELVEISSHTADKAGCDAVAAALAGAARAMGGGALDASVVLSPSGKYGHHVTMTTAAGRAPGAVLLIGHHDTVFPRAAFAGYREDGALLRGPGVLDMKGGLVVVAFALGAFAQAGVLARVPVRVVSVSDEEVGSPEGRQLVGEAAAGAAAALVFESGRAGDQIITRRKGVGGMTVTAAGRAAHAGNSHAEGRNAIWSLARFIVRAQELTDYAAGVTVNVGRIEGGIGKNTVPERAEALVDFRFVDGDAGVRVDAALRAAAAGAAVDGTTLEVRGGVTRAPLERTDASARLAAEYGECQAASGLGAAEAPLLGGGSDANTAHALGVPAIDGLGPRGRGFHTNDEHVERASLVPKAQALVRFLARRLTSASANASHSA